MSSERGVPMKHFYAGTFMSKDELSSNGVDYPIKLEYYKTEDNSMYKNSIKYGIEVIKTSYKKERTKIENSIVAAFTKDEKIVNKILDILKKNEVTPITAEYVVEDLLKQIG